MNAYQSLKATALLFTCKCGVHYKASVCCLWTPPCLCVCVCVSARVFTCLLPCLCGWASARYNPSLNMYDEKEVQATIVVSPEELWPTSSCVRLRGKTHTHTHTCSGLQQIILRTVLRPVQWCAAAALGHWRNVPTLSTLHACLHHTGIPQGHGVHLPHGIQ